MRLYGRYQAKKGVPIKRMFKRANRGGFQPILGKRYGLRGAVKVQGGINVRSGLSLNQNPTAALPVPCEPRNLMRAQVDRVSFTKL